MVAPVLTNSPPKSIASFARSTRSISPLHSMSKSTVAGAGGTGTNPGGGGFTKLRIAFCRLKKSEVFTVSRSDAVALSRSIWMLSDWVAIIQKRPFGVIPGL